MVENFKAIFKGGELLFVMRLDNKNSRVTKVVKEMFILIPDEEPIKERSTLYDRSTPKDQFSFFCRMI